VHSIRGGVVTTSRFAKRNGIAKLIDLAILEVFQGLFDLPT
jgi:hypothetical protein